MESCTDTDQEVVYFENLEKMLAETPIPSRSWEEKSDKVLPTHCDGKCALDIFHCGNCCLQVVLGRLNETQCFIACKNYLVLNISDWNIDLNDLFIKNITVVAQEANTSPLCSVFPIKLYFDQGLPQHEMNEGTTKISPGSVTTREICMIHLKDFNFYLPSINGIEQPFYLASRETLAFINDLYKANKNVTFKLIAE